MLLLNLEHWHADRADAWQGPAVSPAPRPVVSRYARGAVMAEAPVTPGRRSAGVFLFERASCPSPPGRASHLANTGLYARQLQLPLSVPGPYNLASQRAYLLSANASARPDVQCPSLSPRNVPADNTLV